MLKVGYRIKAKLVEAVEKNQWIVSFQGHLLQVKNTTAIQFQEGLILNLQVIKEEPLQLKILSEADPSSRKKLDILV